MQYSWLTSQPIPAHTCVYVVEIQVWMVQHQTAGSHALVLSPDCVVFKNLGTNSLLSFRLLLLKFCKKKQTYRAAEDGHMNFHVDLR